MGEGKRDPVAENTVLLKIQAALGFSGYEVSERDGLLIAERDGHSLTIAVQSAASIPLASPSPDLQEALEALREMVDACDDKSGMGLMYSLDRALPNARATLSKHGG